jgi:hypothetical protein
MKNRAFNRFDVRPAEAPSTRSAVRKHPMDLLHALRSFDVDRISLDEAVALGMFAKQLRSEYESRQLDAPEWLTDKIRSLDRWISAHRRDALEARAKEVRAAIAAALTPAERREKLVAELASLDDQLAKA